MQAKLECWDRDTIELAPTVQCLTGDYRHPESQPLPFLDYIFYARKERIVTVSLQSEEGDFFYHEQNRSLVTIADEWLSDQLPDHYIWIILNQLYYLNQFNNYMNIQARSLLSSIAFS